jgi:hypothetical protein
MCTVHTGQLSPCPIAKGGALLSFSGLWLVQIAVAVIGLALCRREQSATMLNYHHISQTWAAGGLKQSDAVLLF